MSVPPIRRVVVVGHGASGLAAALAAAELGGESGATAQVTLLERASAEDAGGSTRWSPANMRMRSVDEVAPGFEADMLAATQGQGDPAYYRRLAEEAPAAARWLQSVGVNFHQPPYYLSVGPARIQPVGGGAALVERLAARCRCAGIAIRYRCEAFGLARGQDGAIAGVEARTAEGAVERIPTEAVVLACGGFEGSPELLGEHLGPGAESLRPICPGAAYADGSGIRIAVEAGAGRAGDWAGMHIEPVDARARGPAPVVLVYPYGIVVDREGRRFFDEGAGLMHETWEALSRAIHFETPGRLAWAVFDGGLLAIEGYERAIRSDVPPITADSVEALAVAACISPCGLAATVAAYNAAATGDPSRFDASRADGLGTSSRLRPPKSNWARPIRHPPFLAWPIQGAIVYTFGGVATNEKAEVLGQAGPIAGLYAAGEMTGHFYGLKAPNAVAVLRAVVFGRIAGRNAMRYVFEKNQRGG